MNFGLFFRQSTDECGRPAQTEPGLGAEVKVELSECENGEGFGEEPSAELGDVSLSGDLAAWGR